MRLRYYDKHGAEIQVGMLLRHAALSSASWRASTAAGILRSALRRLPLKFIR